MHDGARSIRLGWVRIGAVMATALAACGGTDATEPVAPAPELGEQGSELRVGATGDEVEALQSRLARIGYFPNRILAETYPAWRPIVAHAPTRGVYDDHTAKAVESFQARFGLTPTGALDQATRAELVRPRCGVPDGVARLDSSNKYDTILQRTGTVTFGTQGSSTTNVTVDQMTTAVRGAASLWSSEGDLLLVPSSTPQVLVQFGRLESSPGVCSTDTVGYWDGVSKITLNNCFFKWSTASLTPVTTPRTYDVQTVVAHELGHALGLGHSGFLAATMYAGGPVNDRTLDIDDKIAHHLQYTQWHALPGLATDIDVGGSVLTPGAWIVGQHLPGTDYGSIFGFDYSRKVWVEATGNGLAKRIAVGPGGKPWIIATDGSVWFRTSTAYGSGSWQKSNAGGCATDIAVGGSLDEPVWIVGCGGSPDGGIFKLVYNGIQGSWQQVTGLATRIAVGPQGFPWVVNSAGGVYRRKSANVDSTLFEHFELNGTASDVTVFKSSGGSNNYASIVLNDGSSAFTFTRNEQPSAGTGPQPSAELAEWLLTHPSTNGTPAQLTVDPAGFVWKVNRDGTIATEANLF
jgi:hypothetical protein